VRYFVFGWFPFCIPLVLWGLVINDQDSNVTQ